MIIFLLGLHASRMLGLHVVKATFFLLLGQNYSARLLTAMVRPSSGERFASHGDIFDCRGCKVRAKQKCIHGSLNRHWGLG